MALQDSDEQLKAKGVDVDRSTTPATYSDHRDFLTKMHGALGALLGKETETPPMGAKNPANAAAAVEAGISDANAKPASDNQ